ncbi:hypothetical protein J7F03_02130 [Streptomyces sp. ISL-43]|uniref:hypothetical protein n=1 Tax=Streptomyces sp. ISL-43 TaxID=2819183 RepID=UPI001BEB4C4E|nr:hypothetical protein [Streptomyces sp. ISL-43]MBT2445906.1 hypothetical protein [Streptomyces sp. ISL-43]
MDRDTGIRGREHAVDWLEVAADLPHLFARLSELVHGAGYAPEDLVLIPRSELDRRETASFTAGWAEAMGEDLPRLRREFEKRVAEAYAAGTAGRRGEPRSAGKSQGQVLGVGQSPGQGPGGHGADVIRLPVTALIEPPAPVREAEERVRRAHAILDRQSDTGHAHASELDATAGQSRRHDEPDETVESDEPAESGETAEAASGSGETAEAASGSGPTGPPAEPDGPADEGRAPRATARALLSVQEIREKRTPPVSRKVVRRNGRPIVPPLDSVPVQPRAQGSAADPQAPAGPGRPSLAARARALADEMESKSGASRPVAPEGGR